MLGERTLTLISLMQGYVIHSNCASREFCSRVQPATLVGARHRHRELLTNAPSQAAKVLIILLIRLPTFVSLETHL